MERKIIISHKPCCRICGKFMESWNPFAEVHEHPKCTAEHLSDALMTIVRKSFSDTKTIPKYK